MQRLIPSLCLGLSLSFGLVAPALAETPLPLVEVWSLAQTRDIGQSIFVQDRAASRATDVLLAHFKNDLPKDLIGWIVVPDGDGQLVRFLTGDPATPLPGYDIRVNKNGRPGAVTPASDTPLLEDQAARFFARTTAADDLTSNPTLRCADRYNTVVLDDPDSDGWLVWFIPATTDPNKVSLGGHYRFHISADGKTVDKREQMSAGCLDMDRRQSGQNGMPVGLMTSVIVAPQPLEIHVFLSLLNRLPIFIAAGDKLWQVQGANISEINTRSR